VQSTAEDGEGEDYVTYMDLVQSLKEAVLTQVREELRAEEFKAVHAPVTRIRPRESLQESKPEQKLNEPDNRDLRSKLDKSKSKRHRSPPPSRSSRI
jgi:hypothetical protein